MKSVIAFLAIALTTAVASARVCVYQDSNFRGYSKCWDQRDRVDGVGGYLNDQISSVSMDRGDQVTLCVDYPMRGYCQTYYSNVYGLDSYMNDRVSDIRIRFGNGGYYPPPGPFPPQPPPPQPQPRGDVCFYYDSNLRGASFCVGRNDQDIQALTRDWNDKISSITVPYGVIVVVYSDGYYQGNVRTFTSGTWNMDGGWNDIISSIRILRNRY